MIRFLKMISCFKLNKIRNEKTLRCESIIGKKSTMRYPRYYKILKRKLSSNTPANNAIAEPLLVNSYNEKRGPLDICDNLMKIL